MTTPRTPRVTGGAMLAAACILAACNVREQPATDTGAAASAGAAEDGARLTISGFETPESVEYDEDQDIYLVSNINGNPSNEDDNGYIARVSPDSAGARPTRLVEGGKGGATLNAPKGMAIVGDTLWVADIDAVRAFNRRTGTPIASVALAGATFLNDIAVGPDGALYITDTGIRFDAGGNMTSPGRSRIYKVEGRRGSVALESDTLHGPNGIAWDPANDRFVIVSFGGREVFGWKPGAAAPTVIASGPGQFDGVEIVGGRIIVSSWADSALHAVSGNQMTTVAGNLPGPADIGYDSRRDRVLVPLFSDGRVEGVTVR